MRGGGRLFAATALLLGAIAAGAGGADAAWQNAADESQGSLLVSADYERLEQGDDTTDYAAVSANGRYVVMETLARNFFADDDPDPPGRYRKGGIFRFDLRTRELEKVADGNLFDEGSNAFVRIGASRPSISADGRFVAFLTAESLVSADLNENLDAYVRDMDVPIGATAAFDLVSAADGGDAPALYGPPSFPLPGSEPGAAMTRGTAISADGNRVVFETEAPSNLPSGGSVDVPAGQVYLRDRAARTTTLVTARRDPESGAMTSQPAGGALGASLSPDGTTVAWTGGNAAAQTRFLSGENSDPIYLHYLWRRPADGPQAPTRRVTGAADPDDPACVAPPANFDRVTTGACYGPLNEPEGLPADISSQVPVLSADGRTVAFLTGAAGRPQLSANPGLDLFVTDMSPGVNRKQGTVELTRDTLDNNIATAQPVSSVTISPDGRYLLITCARTKFTFPALTQLGDPRPVPGPREAYVVDLGARTLERVVHSYAGADSDAGVTEGANVSADGSVVAFASFAGNLFYGDSNKRADAFVANRVPDPEGGPPDKALDDGGPAGTVEFDRDGPRISARAKSLKGGAVLLTVSVPSAGGIRAVARARAGRPRRLRTLAAATGRSRGATRSSVRLTLRPVARYRGELRKRGRIRGRAQVTYVASRGGRRAAASVRFAFVSTGAKKRSGGKRK